jgi:hypothetical protein
LVGILISAFTKCRVEMAGGIAAVIIFIQLVTYALLFLTGLFPDGTTIAPFAVLLILYFLLRETTVFVLWRVVAYHLNTDHNELIDFEQRYA